MSLFLNWVAGCVCLLWGWGQRTQGRVLPDSLRKDLDKLRAVLRLNIEANNADPEFLGKVNKFNIFYLSIKRDKGFLSRGEKKKETKRTTQKGSSSRRQVF